MLPLRVGKYCITVSSPALATYNDSEFVGNASALVPAPIEFTVSTVSPETSISVMLPSPPLGLALATHAKCVFCGWPPGLIIGLATGRY